MAHLLLCDGLGVIGHVLRSAYGSHTKGPVSHTQRARLTHKWCCSPQALTRSVPGVSHAFSVVLLVMSIYAILGVELFREVGVNKDGTINMTYGNGQLMDITTPRTMQ
eukprot:7104431-Prymnesium_polylepis.1